MNEAAVETGPNRLDVLGVGISTTSYDEVSKLCSQWIANKRGGRGRYICVSSVHGVMEARRDRRIRSILNNADIVTPDGMPLVWALRSFGAVSQGRVYGPNLMLTLCEGAERLAHRIFLYGGKAETVDALERSLRTRYPDLVIAGKYSPPFRPLTEEEDEEVCGLIHHAQPDLIFVGLSTPKQELWMADHVARFPGGIMIGVGAAFDFHAGRVRQAPVWMQDRGLEWLFRLTQEPMRLWRRYILITPWFLPCWGIQKLSLMMRNSTGRRYPRPGTESTTT
jgi:N-acetylglucosaminyldiphosphoundecaprenol N-acetyl-beta-D-mannosaminyltransferase